MPSQPQTAPNTKSGISNNSTKGLERVIPPVPTNEELAVFYDAIARAKTEMNPHEMPAVETSRKIIEHILREKMRSFDDVQYFIYQNVKVFEEGKRDEAERRDKLTTEEKMHGAR